MTEPQKSSNRVLRLGSVRNRDVGNRVVTAGD